MGFFDKLKGAVNAVTGGAAKVTLEYQPMGFPGESFAVRVIATSTGQEVKSKGVFIDLMGTEDVKIKSGPTNGLSQDVSVSKKTFDQAFQIAPAFVLAPNETKQFDGVVQIPHNLQPTYSGIYSHHQWQIRGRIEAFGNDPDSGIMPFRVGMKA